MQVTADELRLRRGARVQERQGVVDARIDVEEEGHALGHRPNPTRRTSRTSVTDRPLSPFAGLPVAASREPLRPRRPGARDLRGGCRATLGELEPERRERPRSGVDDSLDLGAGRPRARLEPTARGGAPARRAAPRAMPHRRRRPGPARDSRAAASPTGIGRSRDPRRRRAAPAATRPRQGRIERSVGRPCGPARRRAGTPRPSPWRWHRDPGRGLRARERPPERGSTVTGARDRSSPARGGRRGRRPSRRPPRRCDGRRRSEAWPEDTGRHDRLRR